MFETRGQRVEWNGLWRVGRECLNFRNPLKNILESPLSRVESSSLFLCTYHSFSRFTSLTSNPTIIPFISIIIFCHFPYLKLNGVLYVQRERERVCSTAGAEDKKKREKRKSKKQDQTKQTNVKQSGKQGKETG